MRVPNVLGSSRLNPEVRSAAHENKAGVNHLSSQIFFQGDDLDTNNKFPKLGGSDFKPWHPKN
jgi:hypothetical protein